MAVIELTLHPLHNNINQKTIFTEEEQGVALTGRNTTGQPRAAPW